MTKTSLDFKKLPPEIQKQILGLQKPDANRFVFFRRLSWMSWVGVIVSVIWFAYLLATTQNPLWEDWIFWTLTVISLIAAAILVFFVKQIVSTQFSALKNGHVFTPNELLKTENRRVESWSLSELESFQYNEQAKTIEIWIGERQEIISVAHPRDAESFQAVFDVWKRAAETNGNLPILAAYAKPEFAYNPSRSVAGFALGLIFSLLLGAGLVLTAKTLNRSYDDEQKWRLADQNGTIEEYEKYLVKHPNGAFAAQANQKISDKLLKIKDEYLAKVGKDADPNGVRLVAGLVEEAVKSSDRTIYVIISETLNLDEQVVQKIKDQTGLSVASYYTTVPPTATDYRKNKVLNDLKQAFLPVMRNGAAEFQLVENAPTESPAIRVEYKIESAKGYYQYYEMASGKMNLYYYPRSVFTFNAKLMAGKSSESYETVYINNLVNLRDFAVNEKDAANYSFDKLHFGGASESFAEHLEKQLGFPD